jgi:predicted PurR-regulated permease PerM
MIFCRVKPAILLEMNPPRADRLQTLVWTATAFALAGLFWLLGPILAPFVIAAVFAYICDPAVNWMVARRVPRALAVLLVIIGLGLLLVALALILLPMVYREGALLIARLPELIEMFNAQVAPVLQASLGFTLHLDAAQFRQLVTENWSSAQDILPALLGHLKSGGVVLIGFVANLFLIPLVMFYLLQEWPRILGELQHTVPRPWLQYTLRVINDIDSVMSEFLRGQLSVMLLLAVFYSVGLWLAGLKFALPVGVLTGLLVFIPFVGFGGGLVLAIMAALLQGEGWPPLIGVAVVYSLGQLLESFLLTPYLVGERIGLHPLAVIFALMAFGQLFGFVGVLVALPVSAALLVGLREVRSAWLRSPVYLGEPATGAPPSARKEDVAS